MLSTRTMIELRWSTELHHVGYPEPHQIGKDLLKNRRPDFTGTPRQVLAEAARVRRNIGDGTFCAFQFRTHTTQEELDRRDLEGVINAAEYREP